MRPVSKAWWWVLFVACASLAHAQWHALGDVSAVQSLANGVELTAGVARVQVLALSPGVVRLRYAPQGSFPRDSSFAVLPDAFPDAPKVQVKDASDAVVVNTGSLQVRVLKSPLRVVFQDAHGQVIAQDQPNEPVSFNGSAFRVWKAMPIDEHYFGLGDKTGPLDHRELAFTLWNTDNFGWQESTDPLYKAIPFFLGVRNGEAYGIFLDNTYRSMFDFGKEFRDAYSFGADAGELNYYFFYGPDPKRVVSDFTALTGRTPLPPLFSLGYQQCRYSYYPEARVREIADQFRKRKIPADVIYLDIDYQEKNRPFSVDRERFPHFEQMIQDLRQQGFKLITITDLHIAKLPGSKPYDEGMGHDSFVKNPDGSGVHTVLTGCLVRTTTELTYENPNKRTADFDFRFHLVHPSALESVEIAGSTGWNNSSSNPTKWLSDWSAKPIARARPSRPSSSPRSQQWTVRWVGAWAQRRN